MTGFAVALAHFDNIALAVSRAEVSAAPRGRLGFELVRSSAGRERGPRREGFIYARATLYFF